MTEILKERAGKFLETAYELYQKKYYDLCAFNLEQSAQLYLKYALWKIIGDFEKTHSIETLLKQYGQTSNKEKEVNQFIEKYAETINDLEIAYIESRYLPGQYLKSQIDRMFEFVEELKNLLKIAD